MSLSSAAIFAEVAVGGGDLRGPQTFHYKIPPHLIGQVHAGQLVLVPFGSRQLHGIVVQVTDRSPVEATRPIHAVIWKSRLIDRVHVELGRWVAVHYGAPILAALELVAPPALDRSLISSYVPAAGDAGEYVDLTRGEKSALAHIRESGELTAAALVASVGKTAGTRGVQKLIRAGLIDRVMHLRFPEPAGERVLIATASTDDAETERALRRAPKQRAVLAVLRALGDVAPAGEVLRRANASPAAVSALVARGYIRSETKVEFPFILSAPADRIVESSEVDAAAWRAVETSLDRDEASPLLLQGDESDRWAIYAQAIRNVVEAERQVVVVAPDQRTASDLAVYLAARVPGVVADATRAEGDAQRIALWQATRAGEIDVHVGARSAVFGPLSRLGLVVIEREEDPGHKHNATPRYHARTCGIEVARLAGAAVLLGADTPSVEAFYAVESERFRFVLGRSAELLRQTQLRVGRGWGMARPAGYVEVVDLKTATFAGRYRTITRPLFEAVRDTVDAGGRAVLYVNRRGSAAMTICRDCGYVFTCPSCTNTMVHHAGIRQMMCHICNTRAELPRACPECRGSWLRLAGYGSEAVADAIAHLLPKVRVARIDSDAKPEDMDAAVDSFAHDAGVKVLVGTQRLLGYRRRLQAPFLGIVQADIGLHFPDFLAPERVFLALMRLRRIVTGGVPDGRTIVQTHVPNHHVVEAIRRGSYLHFFRAEIAEREHERLPPFRRLARAVVSNASDDAAEAEARRAARELRSVAADLGLSDVELLGPAPAVVARQRGRYRWQLLLLGDGIERLFPLLQYGWTIDADPIDLI